MVRVAAVQAAPVFLEQAALDVVGHYNRPDVFSFSVDARPRVPVDWQEEVAS